MHCWPYCSAAACHALQLLGFFAIWGYHQAMISYILPHGESTAEAIPYDSC